MKVFPGIAAFVIGTLSVFAFVPGVECSAVKQQLVDDDPDLQLDASGATKQQQQHPFNRPEFGKVNRALTSSWGCEPHPAGPQALQTSASYIANEMIPALQHFQKLYSVDGTGGFVSWIDVFRGLNNPWCIVRGKTFVKWGKRLVASMETVDDAFGKAKKIPVIRGYVKKAAFLETFAEKLVKVADTLEEKCKKVEDFDQKVIEFILDKLSDASTVISVLVVLVLPLLESTICGINNLLASIVVALLGAAASYSDGGSGRRLIEPDMSVQEAFYRVLEHVDDHTIKPAILQILNLNADRFADMTILDFVTESFQEDDPLSRRRALMDLNATDIGLRFLSFDENALDLAPLEAAVKVIQEATEIFETLDNKLADAFIFVPDARAFANAVVAPFETIGKVLDPFSPVIDIMSEIAGALSFLECPSFLGFICDLDTIIIGIVERLLAKLGFDVNQLIDDIASELFEALGLPSLADIDLGLPQLDIFDTDAFLAEYAIPFEEKLQDIVGQFLFNPVELAFDKSGDFDISNDEIGGLEFRYSSSFSESARLDCQNVGKFPVVLSASRRTATCGNDVFTAKISATPCGTTSECFIDGTDGDSSCDASQASSFLGIPGIADASIFDMVNVLYTCSTADQLERLDILPSLFSFATGNSRVECPPGEIITIDDLWKDPNYVGGHLLGCLNIVLGHCEGRIESCHFSDCLATTGHLVSQSCLVPGRDTSIPETNVFTGIAFRDARNRRKSVNLDCSMPGGYILVTEVQSGQGLAHVDVEYTACNGLPTCSISMADLGRNDEVLRVTSTCFCGEGYNPIPDLVTGQCIECDAGNYRDADMAACDNCPEGTFSRPGAVFCPFCDTGSFAGGRGNGICLLCSPGTFSLTVGQVSVDDCLPCSSYSEPEFNSIDEPTTLPTPTLTDYFNENEGSDICTPCPAGTEAQESGIGCSDVAFGSFSSEGMGATLCDPGYFSDSLGAQSCKVCPAGTFARVFGSTICEPCPLHTWVSGTSNTICIPCPSGFVIPRVGSNSNVCEAVPDPIDYLDPAYDDFSCEQMLLLDDDPEDPQVNATRRLDQVSNGICNVGPWNTRQCNWDGGDCCIHTCVVPPDTDESISSGLLLRCTQGSFNCLDPVVAGTPFVACLVEDTRRTKEEVEPLMNFMDAVATDRVGDGICDEDLNTALHAYDGGDCCWQSCEKRLETPKACRGTFDTCIDPSTLDKEAPRLVFLFEVSDVTVRGEAAVPAAPQVSAVDDDPCFDLSVDFTEVKSIEDADGTYDLVRTWSATDLSGNTQRKNVTVTVLAIATDEGCSVISSSFAEALSCCCARVRNAIQRAGVAFFN